MRRPHFGQGRIRPRPRTGCGRRGSRRSREPDPRTHCQAGGRPPSVPGRRRSGAAFRTGSAGAALRRPPPGPRDRPATARGYSTAPPAPRHVPGRIPPIRPASRRRPAGRASSCRPAGLQATQRWGPRQDSAGSSEQASDVLRSVDYPMATMQYTTINSGAGLQCSTRDSELPNVGSRRQCGLGSSWVRSLASSRVTPRPGPRGTLR